MDKNIEIEKIKFSHKLEVRRILLEKLLLGVLIALIGFVANVLFENYRDKLSQDRFLLEKRLDAVQKIRKAYDKMHSTFMEWTIDNNLHLPDDYKNKYNEILADFTTVANSNTILISKEFTKQINAVLWIYQAFNYTDIANGTKYRFFAKDINEAFNHACKKELELNIPENQKIFEFKRASWFEAEQSGAPAFMENNYNEWKLWREKNKPE